MLIIHKQTDLLQPYQKNPRNISDKAIDSVAHSIKEFGWKQPLVIDKNNKVIVGHTRLLAAKKLNINEVPVIVADDLTEEKIKAYRILDNRLNEMSEWDEDLLNFELESLKDSDENIKELLKLLEDDQEEILPSNFLEEMSKNPQKEEKIKLDMEMYQSVSFVMLPEEKTMVIQVLRDVMNANGLKTTTQALLKLIKEI